MPQPLAEQLHDRAGHFSHRTGSLYTTLRYAGWVLGLTALVGMGIWMRTLPTGFLGDGQRWPWQTRATVNLYFLDGPFLFPVSRRLPADDQLARAALEGLLAGSSRAGRLRSAIPRDVEIRSFAVAEGVARIDLSRSLGEGDAARLALAAITETMTRVPGVTSIAVSVQGRALGGRAYRTPLLYYPTADGLVAVPTSAGDPRAALAAYLSGPPVSEMTGMPADVRLLAYDYDATDGLLSVGFTYTPAVRALALEEPDRTRTLLLGLIATLTEFPEVRAVRLDFGGQSRLGLGECSDLLRSPQPRPALLNDERLID